MTVREAYAYTIKTLSVNEELSPVFEARILFEELFGLTRLKLAGQSEREFTAEEKVILDSAAAKRLSGVPLQYITGKWSFMDREYYVGEGVLIPRDDTEVVVREFYDGIKNIHTPKLADLCSGSGIIALTLSGLLPESSIAAIEKEDAAFEYLKRNTELHKAENVTIIKGDIFVCHEDFENESLDGVISNPPYIETDVIPQLQTEVQSEPKTALDGGADGLDFYRCIAEKWLPKLRCGGIIAVETGETQAMAVSELFEQGGAENIRVIKDIQGLDRVIYGTKK